MVDGIKIEELDPTVLPSLQHRIPTMKDGVTVYLTVGQIIDLLVGTAPEALDTWGELVAQIQANQGGLTTLLADVALKAYTSQVLALAGGTMSGNINVNGFRLLNALIDTTCAFSDAADNTKRARFDLTGLSTGVTRFLKLPNRNLDLTHYQDVLFNDFIGTGTEWSLANLEGYRSLSIEGFLRGSSNGGFSMEFSTDQGATWKTGASDYAWQSAAFDGATTIAARSTATSNILLSGSTGVTTVQGASLDVKLQNFNATRPTRFDASLHYVDPSGNDWARTIKGRRLVSEVNNAIRISSQSGAFGNDSYVIVRGFRG